MESYSPLLERLRLPQSSLQRFAVVSIFEKLRSAPPHLNADSDTGRSALSQCLLSSSPPAVDQSVRELCRLAIDAKINLSRGFLELQAALEGCDSRFVPLFVKAIGLLARFGFRSRNPELRSDSAESHHFVKVLVCREEVQSELVQQVLLFIAENKRFGIVEVCEFLKPFLNFSVLRIPFVGLESYSFVKQLISSLALLCCSFPSDAMPLFKLLVQCLIYFPCKAVEDFRNFIYLGECMVDACIVILRELIENRLSTDEAQCCSMELLETILSPNLDTCMRSCVMESAVGLSKRLLVAQKDLGLPYMHQMLLSAMSLLFPLVQSQLEHEELSILRLLLFILRWKSEYENDVGNGFELSEEVLFIFPVINLVSSPSKPIKGTATELLFMLDKRFQNLLMLHEKESALHQDFPELSRPESLISRLLQHLWFQDQSSKSYSFFQNLASMDITDNKEIHNRSESWVSQLKKYAIWIIERRRSPQSAPHSREAFSTEMPLVLASVAGVLLMHPSQGKIAADFLAAIGVLVPKLGVTLLLAILYYNNSFSNNEMKHHDMSLKCLGMLPSLASHSAMAPLVIQTVLPMLHVDAKPVLYATAIRLLCKTWEINDRAFGSLQAVLLPKWFTEFVSEKHICISIAASIRDVCRSNPDRGVDLILSVSACVESHYAIVQALGFQSLAHLCEADVIDFYTAWAVIAKNVQGSLMDPVVSRSVCLFLRWGALDAEAYPEASTDVLRILWEIGTTEHDGHASLWAKARVSAFEALTHYEVFHVGKCIPDVKSKSMERLILETNPEVLDALEGLEVKIMMHEHINRRRLVKEKRVTGNKIEKLLDVLPQVIFSSGKKHRARDLPGAALLCLSFNPKDVNNLVGSQTVYSSFENTLVDIAASLQLSRNVLVALLSLQSWKPFIQRWMRAIILCLETKMPSTTLPKTSKVANDILKIMQRIAEESIPRSAENMALAIGALCAVLPPSVHVVKASASKFLLNWLFQYEHEYRQWSAAISLGLISSCLHVTDHKQKFENINGLIEVLHGSKSMLVRGACGVGLGFSFQDLLTRAEVTEESEFDQETYRKLELNLLGKIVQTLSLTICQQTQSSPHILQDIAACFPLSAHDSVVQSSIESCEDFEDDIWGVAGLVIGLGSSVTALYRAGLRDAVLKIKTVIMSWFLCMNPAGQRSSPPMEWSESVLLVGSCLVLPSIVAFCLRVELMDDDEVDHLLNGYMDFISELSSISKSGAFHQSLMMASCTGAGNLLANILNEGVHSVKIEVVQGLMDLFRKGYSTPNPPFVHLGGMLGVVNSLGAGAGTVVHYRHPGPPLHNSYDKMDSLSVMGPLVSSSACEPHLTSLMQEMFLVAQNSEDLQLQQYAAWAVSFLRYRLWSKDIHNFESSSQNDAPSSHNVSQGFSDDSSVMKLSLWLMNHSMAGNFSNIDSLTTVLRCLSQAPRIPEMDWETIIRRCMRFGAQCTQLMSSESAPKKEILREECVRFALAHANQFDVLLSFLDELSDLPRFQLLGLNLQSCLLACLGDLRRVFAASRLEKLFHDMASYFSSLNSSYEGYNINQKGLLRISCWKGLYQCLDEASFDTIDHMSRIEKCMEVLFFSLPAVQSAAFVDVNNMNLVDEWSSMLKCLEKAPRDWLSDLLRVNRIDGEGQVIEVSNKLRAKARLIKTGSIALTELGKLKANILNIKSHVIWDVLVDVVAALQQADRSIKKQWLVDAVEICCVTSHPSTALQFLGLVSGSFCKYMPLLILDRLAVLSDLPVTLPSLLSEPSWEVIAESVVSRLLTVTERIYRWVTHSGCGDDSLSLQTINDSENEMAVFLLRVLHRTCLSLKEYLSLEKQLWLANIVIG